MVDRTWTGVTLDWHVPTNWTPNGVPTLSDNVTINGSGYVLCWATAPIECNNITLTAAMTELLIFEQGGIIHGDVTIDGGYFGATGGGGYVIEIKGNLASSGTGQIAIGTGTGRDPEVDFSGIGKTYVWNSTNPASFQHLTFSGEIVCNGTKLSVAWVNQEFAVTGELDIDKNGIFPSRIDLDGTFPTLTGSIIGYGRIFYHYDSSSTIPSGGIIGCQYFHLYIEDATATISTRTWQAEVELEYITDGQKVSLEGGTRHRFLAGFTIYCGVSGVNAELNLEDNDAKIWVEGEFKVNKDAFASGSLTIMWGNQRQVFRATINFYFAYTGNSHLYEDWGTDGLLFLYPKGLEIIILEGGGGL